MRLDALKRQRAERKAEKAAAQAVRQEKAINRAWMASMSMRRTNLVGRPFNVDLRKLWRMDAFVAGQIAGYLNVRDTFAGLLPRMVADPAFANGVRDSESLRWADIADDLFDLREKSEAGFYELARIGLGPIRAAELVEALKGHVKTRRNLHADFVSIARLVFANTSGRQDAKKVPTVKP